MPRRLATTFVKLTPERYAAIAMEMRAVADGGTDAAKVAMATTIAEAVLQAMATRPANLAEAVATAVASLYGGKPVAEVAEADGGEAASPIVYGPFMEEGAAALARLEAVEAEHRAVLQQIQDERLDAALIGEMKADAQLVAQNRAILGALEAARAADVGEAAGEDGEAAVGEDGEAEAGEDGEAEAAEDGEAEAAEDGEAAAGEDDGDEEAAGEDDGGEAAVEDDGSDEEMPDAEGVDEAGEDADGIFFADSDEDMPDVPAGPAGEDDDGWGSSIEFEMSNAGVILISDDDE
nr:myristoylated alanine-rich C-kinase substrate-like [Aegilops tauschii subsp. strangulata]